MFNGSKRQSCTSDLEAFETSGRFTINNTTDPDGIVGDFVTSITRADTGDFLFTFDNTVAELHYLDAVVYADADHTCTFAGITDVEGAGTKTATLHIRTAGSAADPANNVMVGFFLRGKLTTRTR